MATTSVYLDKRRMKVDGTFPLRIKVTLNGRQGFMINLPISLTADQWNNGKVVRHTSKDIYNRHIREQVHNVEKTLLSMHWLVRVSMMTRLGNGNYRQQKRPTFESGATYRCVLWCNN